MNDILKGVTSVFLKSFGYKEIVSIIAFLFRDDIFWHDPTAGTGKTTLVSTIIDDLLKQKPGLKN